MTDSNLLTRDEAARRLGVGASTLAAWATRRQNIPVVKVGRAVRYRPEDLETFIAGRTIALSQSAGGPR